MAHSDLWRDLAVQFLALAPSPHGDIRASWQYTVGSGIVGNWMLGGGGSTLRIQVEALARRAAIGLPHKRSPDLLVAWLEAIREDGRGFELSNFFPTELHDDGSKGVTYMLGSINRVCEASANFCRILESRALQAEFEEKQRAQVAPTQAATRFRPLDENYQIIEFDGREYELTPTQSTVIRALHVAHTEKRGSVGIKELQKTLGIHSGKMSAWFRRKNHDLYKKLILHTGQQHYRLDL